jgi:hypothetical protein
VLVAPQLLAGVERRSRDGGVEADVLENGEFLGDRR